jgi:hypothetical protein
MTEEEWMNCCFPDYMLAALVERCGRRSRFRRGYSTSPPFERKARLFICACTRRLRAICDYPQLLQLVCLAEDYADGIIGRKDLRKMASSNGALLSWTQQAREWVRGWLDEMREWQLGPVISPRDMVRLCVDDHPFNSLHTILANYPFFGNDAFSFPVRSHVDVFCLLCGLLRDCFELNSNANVDSAALLNSNDGVVLQLSRHIYSHAAFAEMPILADALEEAGCNHDAILSHCRSACIHTRGCWALDRILGM